MTKAKLFCELVIKGFEVAPDQITADLELEPSEIIHIGDIKHADPDDERPPILHDSSIWSLSSGVSESTLLEDHVAALLERLAPAYDAIATLSSKYEVILSIYGDVDEPYVGCNFTNEQLKALARMGADLDVDIYTMD